jgi:superfamily II DNA or RNA helicase
VTDLEGPDPRTRLAALAARADAHQLAIPLEVWACRPRTPLSLVAALYDLAVTEGCTEARELLTRTGFHRRVMERPDGRQLVDALADDLRAWLEEPTWDLTTPSPSEGLTPAMDPDDLERWAAARGLRGALDAPARRVLAEAMAGNAETWLWFEGARGVSVRRVITAQTARSRAWPSRTAAPVAAQAGGIEFLGEVAEIAAAGVREEAELAHRALPPPMTPQLTKLRDRLIEERERLREWTYPRPRSSVDGRLVLDPEQASLTWVEQGAMWCSPKPRQEVTIPLGTGRPTPSCDCSGRSAGRCPVALAALDAVLDAVTSPGRQVMARRIDRVLTEVSKGETSWAPSSPILPAVEAPPDLAHLGWRVQTDPVFGLHIEPIVFAEDGTATRISPRLVRLHPDNCPLPADRRAAEQLLPGTSWLDGSSPLLDRGAVHRAVAALVGHPRVVTDDGVGDTVPLRVERHELALHWSLRDDGGVDVTATLGDIGLDPERLSQLAMRRAASGLMVSVDAGVGLAAVTPVAPGALRLLGMLGRQQLSHAGASDTLLARLPAFSRLVPVHLDPSLRGEETAADASPIVRLEVLPQGALRVQVRVRPLPRGQVLVPGQGPQEVFGRQEERRVFARRNLEQEEELAASAVPELPDDAGNQSWEATLDDPDGALTLIERLQESADTRVEWTGEVRHRVIGSAGLGSLRVAVRSLGDWLGIGESGLGRFGVDGELTVGGRRVPLSALFAAVRDGRQYVETDDAGWVRLEQGLLDGLTRAAAGLFGDGDQMQVTPVHAAAFVGLAQGGATLEAPEPFVRLLDDVRAAMELDPEPPAAFEGDLRDYQRDGFRWMVRLAAWTDGGVLADDMGLGKTIQALALLLHRSHLGPSLVVAPTSVGFNWLREAERFAPTLTVELYRGHERRGLLDEVGKQHVFVTSYELLLRDQAQLSSISWSTLVLDEAQAIKNPRARRSLAAASLTAGFRIALTGTPIENRLGELWSVFRALNPGLLGTAEQFRQRFALPVERDRDRGRQGALSALIRPFVLRRVKEEVAKELPARTEVEVSVTLSPEERELYESLRLAAVSELSASQVGPAQRRLQALTALTRLRQAACHPRLVDEASTLRSSKLARLRELVEELREEGHRALIFSQFVRHLALVQQVLEEDGVSYRYLDGSTPERARRREVDAFQDGEGDVFLISLRAGGTGLNLTAATYVIHLDPWWNPAVEDQATDRTHRIGQTQPVTVYRLVTRGTIEESILSLHDHKRSLVAGVLAGTAEGATLGVDDILELLGA